MTLDGFWISAGLVIIASTLPWVTIGGGEQGAVLIFLLGAAVIFRAIARPVSSPLVPQLPLGQWALVAGAAAAVVWVVLLFPTLE